jgi:hypothetical protein
LLQGNQPLCRRPAFAEDQAYRHYGVAELTSFPLPEAFMNLHLTIGPVVSLIAGILILAVPRLLNYIVAIYLILIGLLELFGSSGLRLH